MRAAIAEVVVLPFVAEMSALPAGSRVASLSTAPGSSFQRSFPGTVVPPPAPAIRERPAAARASRISAESGTRSAIAGTLPLRSLIRGNLGPVSPCRGMKVAVERTYVPHVFAAAGTSRDANSI
jgi:hypothetical protein